MEPAGSASAGGSACGSAGPRRGPGGRGGRRGIPSGASRGRSGRGGRLIEFCHTAADPGGHDVATTGLSADPKEYRKRLAEQTDEQIDAWVAELIRDVVIRRGIVKVVDDF